MTNKAPNSPTLVPVETPKESPGWDSWPKEAWKEPSTALVAYGDGGGIILAYEGPHLDYDINEVGQGWGTDETIGDPPDLDPGLWIWAGRLIDTSFDTDYGREYDSELSGEWRPLTDEEWDRFRKGEPVLEPSPFRPKYPEDTNDDD